MRHPTLALAVVALFVLAVGSLAGPRAAYAQRATATADEDRDREAQALFTAGEVAFQQGRYENALEHFTRAYELSGRAQLLYNVGVAAERLRLDRRALDAFEGYLAALDDPPNRVAVERRVAILRQALEREAITPGTEAIPAETAAAHAPVAAESALPAPIAAESPLFEPGPSEGRRSGAGAAWVLMGGGVAVALAGGVLLGLAAADVSTVEGASPGTPWDDVRGAYERSRPRSIAGGVLVGVGVAAAGTGLVWALARRGGDARPALEAEVGVGSFLLRGRF